MKEYLVPWKKRSAAARRERGDIPFNLLHREINGLFDTYYQGFGKPARFDAPSGFEVSETDAEIRVKAELPGMDEKDINVTLDEDVLTIQAERTDEREEKKRNDQVSEMSRSRFHRRFQLSAAVDRDKVKAKFKRGVLTLTLPKAERNTVERERVPVSVE